MLLQTIFSCHSDAQTSIRNRVTGITDPKRYSNRNTYRQTVANPDPNYHTNLVADGQTNVNTEAICYTDPDPDPDTY